jgi:hypothetical protein
MQRGNSFVTIRGGGGQRSPLGARKGTMFVFLNLPPAAYTIPVYKITHGALPTN